MFLPGCAVKPTGSCDPGCSALENAKLSKLLSARPLGGSILIRPILFYPDKRLREPGKDVEVFDAELHRLIDDMAETMYAAPGVGLAAPQIGESKRLFIVDVASGEDEPSDLRVFINPEIIAAEGETVFNEGCLSFPGVREDIDRAERVTVRALDQDGKPFEL